MAASGSLAHAFPTLSECEHRAQLRRAVIAGTIGTTIARYDFFLYSTVTGLVFAKRVHRGGRQPGRHPVSRAEGRECH
jgi:hypothetical protein